MDPILAFGALLFGAILGSFLNAVTFRYHTGARLWRAMQGRSRCMRCSHALGPGDLVPIFSYLFLRGRCRYCSAKISIQYPLVEMAAALLSLGIYQHYQDPARYGFWLIVWMVILFLVIYDWRLSRRSNRRARCRERDDVDVLERNAIEQAELLLGFL